jgi:hypothetical protein
MEWKTQGMKDNEMEWKARPVLVVQCIYLQHLCYNLETLLLAVNFDTRSSVPPTRTLCFAWPPHRILVDQRHHQYQPALTAKGDKFHLPSSDSRGPSVSGYKLARRALVLAVSTLSLFVSSFLTSFTFLSHLPTNRPFHLLLQRHPF